MNFFNFIIWSANPEIFPNIDWLPIRWYGLLFALGFVFSQQLMYYIFKAEGKTTKDVDILTLFMIVATILGARLGHVMFYEPLRYLKDPISILKTWEGGLASHGAAIGIMTGIWLYVNYHIDINPFKMRFIWRKSKKEGQSFFWVSDRIVIMVALTGALIRFGNYINAEIIGIPTRTDSGVVFARDVIDVLEYMPQVEKVQIKKDKDNKVDESGFVPVQIIIDFDPKVNNSKLAGTIVSTNVKTRLSSYEYVTMHIHEPFSHPIRFEIKKIKNNSFRAIIKTKAIPRHPAQLYESVSTFLLFLLLLAIWYKTKEKTPEGRLFGIFMVVLFTLRFFYEFIKENQVTFEDNLPLNMGQWLSIPLVLLGIYILVYQKRFQPKNS